DQQVVAFAPLDVLDVVQGGRDRGRRADLDQAGGGRHHVAVVVLQNEAGGFRMQYRLDREAGAEADVPGARLTAHGSDGDIALADAGELFQRGLDGFGVRAEIQEIGALHA